MHLFGKILPKKPLRQIRQSICLENVITLNNFQCYYYINVFGANFVQYMYTYDKILEPHQSTIN